ncbi:SAM-dependent methyltransferase [Glycomyces sp. L485]|uniref:N-6 DNA methylase n=1 Tax=Glycomyces sp. L485 TaxID=2909235 RepID=UPI001F4A1BA9|nr:N-6 DNA methylase [Glycomyces sp. L485]MCH7232907.1 SAM-dependent methyltransferase [Glycomyces sp. L485]
MTEDETITLTDLARLAEVGRNAVSNWRRREADFPSPVDEGARRPRFALADVERWAAEHGRRLRVTAADRLWFSLQSAFPSPDHTLQAIASALSGHDGEHRTLARQLEELTADTEPAALFEFFIERAREAAGTGTPPGIGALVDIAAACAPKKKDLTVHDPACDEGDLLTELVRAVPGITAVTGQDLSPTRGAICEQRLRLARPDADVRVHIGDSLLSPLPDERFDLVVSDPPFNLKDWGYDRLPAGDDPRLAYGTPPRTEPELAWALHCLALLAPGGIAVVRMPAMVAHRRSGRRIRSELLRWGALRAVIDHPDSKAHIWVLAPRAETTRLLVSTGADFDTAWHATGRVATAHSATVPLMQLWDEDVDISPAVYLAAADTDTGQLDQHADRLAELLDTARNALPRFGTAAAGTAPETTLADLERDGLIAVTPGATDGTGVVVDPLRPQTVRLGDLDTALETQWTIACEAEAVDPGWLAAVIAARLPTATKRTATGVKRRLLAVKVPRIALAEQRRRGAAFAKVLRLRDALQAAEAESTTLADGTAAGLVNGTITVDE